MSTITKSVNVEARSVSFKFGDKAERTYTLDQFTPIADALALHGLSQIGGDAYAGAKNAAAESDPPRDVLDVAIERHDERMKSLLEGKMSSRGTGESKPRETAIDLDILSQAVAKAYGKDAGNVHAKLSAMRAEKKHADVRKWRDDPKVLPTYTRLMEKAGKLSSANDASMFD